MNNANNKQLIQAFEKFENALDVFSDESTGAAYNGQPFWGTDAGQRVDKALLILEQSIKEVKEGL